MADTLSPAFEKVKAEIGDFAKTDEDIMDFILFPQIAEKYLKSKYAKPEGRTKRTIKYTVEAIHSR